MPFLLHTTKERDAVGGGWAMSWDYSSKKAHFLLRTICFYIIYTYLCCRFGAWIIGVSGDPYEPKVAFFSRKRSTTPIVFSSGAVCLSLIAQARAFPCPLQQMGYLLSFCVSVTCPQKPFT